MARVRGPKSRLVERVFLLLLERGPMRSRDLARELGVEPRYVASYLSYWRARGYVDYVSGFWVLTPAGKTHALLARAVGEPPESGG